MLTDRKEYLRNYQREWMKKRRAAWFADKCCVQCGNTEDLELDHIDPSTKENRGDHCIWSWSKVRRDAEIAKCQVLCYDCHNTKSSAEKSLRQSSFVSPFRPKPGVDYSPMRRMKFFRSSPNLPSKSVSDAPDRI